jgi:hypothetical protein
MKSELSIHTVSVCVCALVAARLGVTAQGGACDRTHKNCHCEQCSVPEWLVR